MTAAALTPRPITSPITRAVRPAPSSMTSYQSPPTCVPSTPGAVVGRDPQRVGIERRLGQQAGLQLVGQPHLPLGRLPGRARGGQRIPRPVLLGHVLLAAAQPDGPPGLVPLEFADDAVGPGVPRPTRSAASKSIGSPTAAAATARARARGPRGGPGWRRPDRSRRRPAPRRTDRAGGSSSTEAVTGPAGRGRAPSCPPGRDAAPGRAGPAPAPAARGCGGPGRVRGSPGRGPTAPARRRA